MSEPGSGGSRLTELTADPGRRIAVDPADVRAALSALAAPPHDRDALLAAAAAPGGVAAGAAVRADAITPVVDDPEAHGAIAGVDAITALRSLGAAPVGAIAVHTRATAGPDGALEAMLAGAEEQAAAEGAPVLGRWAIDGDEPAVGLIALGTVDPEQALSPGAGAAGDLLVLTKPLGTGAIAAGIRAGAAGPASVGAAVTSMRASVAPAAEAAIAAGVRCAIAVGEGGLLGALWEVAAASGVGAAVRIDRVPALPGALDHVGVGVAAAGAERNRELVAAHVEYSHQITEAARALLVDPQVAGGLLVAIAADRFPALMGELAARGVRSSPIGRLLPEPAGRVGVLSPVSQVGASGGGSRTAAREDVPEGGPPEGAPPLPPA